MFVDKSWSGNNVLAPTVCVSHGESTSHSSVPEIHDESKQKCEGNDANQM